MNTLNQVSIHENPGTITAPMPLNGDRAPVQQPEMLTGQDTTDPRLKRDATLQMRELLARNILRDSTKVNIYDRILHCPIQSILIQTFVAMFTYRKFGMCSNLMSFIEGIQPLLYPNCSTISLVNYVTTIPIEIGSRFLSG